LAAAPGSFTIANPAADRRSIFPRYDHMDLGRNSQDVGEAVLRSVNVVQAGERTRAGAHLAANDGPVRVEDRGQPAC